MQFFYSHPYLIVELPNIRSETVWMRDCAPNSWNPLIGFAAGVYNKLNKGKYDYLKPISVSLLSGIIIHHFHWLTETKRKRQKMISGNWVYRFQIDFQVQTINQCLLAKKKRKNWIKNHDKTHWLTVNGKCCTLDIHESIYVASTKLLQFSFIYLSVRRPKTEDLKCIWWCSMVHKVSLMYIWRIGDSFNGTMKICLLMMIQRFVYFATVFHFGSCRVVIMSETKENWMKTE